MSAKKVIEPGWIEEGPKVAGKCVKCKCTIMNGEPCGLIGPDNKGGELGDHAKMICAECDKKAREERGCVAK